MMTMAMVRENNNRISRLQNELNEVNSRINRLEAEMENAKTDEELSYADYQHDLAIERRFEIIREIKGY